MMLYKSLAWEVLCMSPPWSRNTALGTVLLWRSAFRRPAASCLRAGSLVMTFTTVVVGLVLCVRSGFYGCAICSHLECVAEGNSARAELLWCPEETVAGTTNLLEAQMNTKYKIDPTMNPKWPWMRQCRTNWWKKAAWQVVSAEEVVTDDKVP